MLKYRRRARQLEEQSQNLKFEDGELAEQELRNLQMKKVQLKQQYDEAQKMYRNAAVRLENWKVRWNSATNNLKIWESLV